MRKIAAAACLVAVIAAIVVGVVQTQSSERTPVKPPQPLTLAQVSEPIAGAPPALAALHRRVNVLEDGGPAALDRELRALRGHPVVVNLWASWCHPCRFELPFFQRQAVKRGARVAFVGVNSGDSAEGAKAFAAELPMPYPSISDPRQKVAGRYGAVGLPVTAFYDARGKLQIVHQGQFPSEAKLSAAIERYATG